MAKGSSGGAKYGVNSQGNATGAPKGTASGGGKLMNTTSPTSGGNPPKPPTGTSAVYGEH